MRCDIHINALFLFIFTSYLLLVTAALDGDPYKILGINRRATTQEIRKAYKYLAKAMHPDKSKDPEAEAKFVEMKQAYELLSDPARRRRYDEKGITEESVNQNRNSYFTQFDDLFSQHGFHFNFQENDISFFYKLSITTRQFEKVILPKSEKIPYLVFFYTDWCFQCLQMAPYWRKLIELLEPLGVNLVTVHSEREPNLPRRLNIHSLPCIVLILDGNTYVYKGTITSLEKIIDFVRKSFPYNMVKKITDDNIGDFLKGWDDNRVRGLIFDTAPTLRLRFYTTAYHFRKRVAFGLIESEAILNTYQIPRDMCTVLLFNENSSWPMASVSMKDIPGPTLHQVVSTNQYLALPRLSSQEVLESICPCEWNKPRKRLCVVLVTEDSEEHDSQRDTFRTYAQSAPYSPDRVRFAYIYHDKQTDFIEALIPSGSSLQPILDVVIIWRRDPFNVKYEWLEETWPSQHSHINDTTQKLENVISRLLKSTEALTYEALVKDLFDEHATHVLTRIFSKIVSFLSSVYDGLDKDQLLPLISIVATVVSIVGIGYFLSYLVRIEEERIQRQQQNKEYAATNNNYYNTGYQPELKLHELRAETYNGLVRMLKPGCRTLVLILDMQSRQQLIPPYHKAVWPFRKNKTLMFSYMFVERGLSWYKELLELSLPEYRDLHINPRNCVGTVLALTGLRKYFCMFHAKHTESSSERIRRKKYDKSREKDCESGAFIGFDSDTSESEDEVLYQENLLDGLPNWLDRLFEGTTQRYHINYWPEFPIK